MLRPGWVPQAPSKHQLGSRTDYRQLPPSHLGGCRCAGKVRICAVFTRDGRKGDGALQVVSSKASQAVVHFLPDHQEQLQLHPRDVEPQLQHEAQQQQQQQEQHGQILNDPAGWLLGSSSLPVPYCIPHAAVHQKLILLSSLLPGGPPTMARLVHRHPPLLTLSHHQLHKQLLLLQHKLQLQQLSKVQQLAVRHPGLLLLSSEQLDEGLTNVGELLPSPRSCSSALASAQPLLLLTPKPELQSRLHQHAVALGLPLAETTSILAARPNLVFLSPWTMGQKRQHLSALLGISPDRGTTLIRKAPALLELSGEALTAKVACLEQLLFHSSSGVEGPVTVDEAVAAAGPQEGPAAVVAADATITSSRSGSSGSTVTASWSHARTDRVQAGGRVQAGASSSSSSSTSNADGRGEPGSRSSSSGSRAMYHSSSSTMYNSSSSECASSRELLPQDEWVPGHTSSSSCQHNSSSRSSAGSSSSSSGGGDGGHNGPSSSSCSSSSGTKVHRGLSRVVFEEPSLLTRSSRDLSSKVQALQLGLGLDASQLQQLLRQRPALLTRSVGAVERSFRALSVWRFESGFKQQLVTEHPVLLRLSPREVHGRCRWVRSLMMRNAYLHAVMRELPPKLVGVVLLHLPHCWPRLQYLAESGREMAVPLMGAVQMPEGRFTVKFPEYAKWREFTKHQVEAPWRVRIRRCSNKVGRSAAQQRQQRQCVLQAGGGQPGCKVEEGGACESSSSNMPENPCTVWVGSSRVRRPGRQRQQQRQQQKQRGLDDVPEGDSGAATTSCILGAAAGELMGEGIAAPAVEAAAHMDEVGGVGWWLGESAQQQQQDSRPTGVGAWQQEQQRLCRWRVGSSTG